MCGILGWYAPSGRAPASRQFVQALTTIRHRGPDGQGVFAAPGVRLGHVRLAVLDPALGRQPWVDPETGVAMVYNGEMYTYRAERELLERRGHAFTTDCDTEVLVKMYLEYGCDMIDRLNGMFAFAIYDPRDKSLFCGRDHAGVKPFYYRTLPDGAVIFGSEIKALLALGGPVAPNPQGVADYLHFQYMLGEKTMFEGVRRLLPGACMHLRPEGPPRLRQWFSLTPETDDSLTFQGASAALREHLDASVRLQLRSDVPLGAHLSGGLDTGVICSLASKALAPDRINTFTAGFAEGGVFDDTSMAGLTAAHIGAEHHSIHPTADDFARLYPMLVHKLDEPMAGQGVFAQYMVSELASRKVKVVLGGQGADEILGGYTRYYILLLECALRNGAGFDPVRLGVGLEDLAPSLNQLHNYAPLLDKVRRGGGLAEPEVGLWRMIDRSGGFASQLSPDLLASLDGYSAYDAFREQMARHGEAELLPRVLIFEASNWLPALLHVEDRMSMAVSIESRVPMLDPNLMRFALTLPTRISLHKGRTKALLRHAGEDALPEAISKRRDKLGFPVPTGRWFKGPLREFLADVLLSQASKERGFFRPEALEAACGDGDGDFDRALWGMLNLELWAAHCLTPKDESLPPAFEALLADLPR